MKRIMVDLETMGQGPNAAIIAIGAVMYDSEIRYDFYRVVDLQSSVSAGGAIDPSTVMWLLKQSEAARSAFLRNGVPIARALQDFNEWSNTFGEFELWGNGANFDNVILRSAMERCYLSPPWKFWNDRCFRTLKALYPQVKMQKTLVAHNALDDAKMQALHHIAIDKFVNNS